MTEEKHGGSGRTTKRQNDKTTHLASEQRLDLLKVGDDAIVDDDKLVVLVAGLRVAVDLGGVEDMVA